MHVAVASQRRTEVRPPALFSLSRPRWQRWLARTWQWLWDLDDSPPPAPSSMGALWGIKAEFSAALWDLQSLPANRVRDEVACARSLRELWHLRAEVFKVVAMHRGQIQAQARLDVLDGHFPVRCSTRRSEAGRQGRASRW